MTGSNLTNLKQIELDILPFSKAATGPLFLLNLNGVINPEPRLNSDDVPTQTHTKSVIFLEP